MAILRNVTMEVKGNNLVITVPLNKEVGPSGSGKTTIIGSTGGAAPIAGKDGMFANVNVYKYAER